MPRIHDDERDTSEAVVRRLVDAQFPQWRDLPLERAGDGTVNAIFRLGGELSVRMPRRGEWGDDEKAILARLASHLPVEIPRFVARGDGFTVHTWLEGTLPERWLPVDELASLILALRAIDAMGAPEPAGGRGRPLRERDAAVRDALTRVDAPGALELWDVAMRAPEWEHERVWVHCDLDARNVLVRDGRLTGVLDWGGAGAGDPALDVMAAWKLVAPAERERFRELLDVDDATWLRAKGWAVSQALIALGYYTLENYPPLVNEARNWLAELRSG
jgi:aminoglycoside phosphotransferase (APT) family kinase protein